MSGVARCMLVVILYVLKKLNLTIWGILIFFKLKLNLQFIIYNSTLSSVLFNMWNKFFKGFQKMERAFILLVNITTNPNMTSPNNNGVLVNLISMSQLSLIIVLLNIFSVVWSEATHLVEVKASLSRMQPWRFTDKSKDIILSNFESPAI